MRDRTPQALPRAPPSFGACGGARTHTRTGPQHRSRPGYAGAWQRPGRQAARACHARSHPTSSTARATVLWRVWWRAHPHPYQPAASFAPGLYRRLATPRQASRPRLPCAIASRQLYRARHRPLARVVARAPTPVPARSIVRAWQTPTPTPAQNPTPSKLRHYQTERSTLPKDHSPQDICRLHRQHTAPRNQREPKR